MAGCGNDKPSDATPVSATADEVKITTTAETTAAIPQIDCFEGVEITISGISPDGKLALNKENASQDIRKFVNFSADLSSGIQNGDTVVVTASYDNGSVMYKQTKKITANLPTYLTIEDVRNGAEFQFTDEEEQQIITEFISLQGSADDAFKDTVYLGTDRDNWSDFIYGYFSGTDSVILDKVYYVQYETDFYIHVFYTITNNYDVDYNMTNAQRVQYPVYIAEEGKNYSVILEGKPISEQYNGNSTVSYPAVGHVMIKNPRFYENKIVYDFEGSKPRFNSVVADVYLKTVNPYDLGGATFGYTTIPLPGYDLFDDISVLQRDYSSTRTEQDLIQYVEIAK
jgi:hypothetical protein